MSNYSNFNPNHILIPGLPYELGLECLLRVPITSHPSLKLVSHTWNSWISNSSFYSERTRLGLSDHLLFLIQPLSQPPPDHLGTTKDHLTQPPILTAVDENCVDGSAGGGGGGPPMYNLNIYNLNSREWRRLSSLQVPIFAQCVAVPTVRKVVVLGGWDPLSLEPMRKVIVIDLVTSTWKEGAPMPTARSFFATVALAGSTTVYVAGGHDGQKNALRSAEAYDVISDTWWALPMMSEERDESHGLSFDGSKFWVISGYGTDSQGRFRSDCEVFDPETRTWSVVDGVWPHPSKTPKSTVVIDSKEKRKWILIVDGQVKEFEWEEKRWKGLDSSEVPDRIKGSSSISLVDIGEGEKEGLFVMGNGGDCGEDECECGGNGVFILEKGNSKIRKNCDGNGKKEGVSKWNHVHAPSNLLGLPFSTCHMFI